MSQIAPQIAEILQTLRELPVDKRPIAQLGHEGGRERSRQIWTGYWNASPVWIHTVRDAEVATPAGPVPVRIYDPDSDGTRPVMFFHGGGFVVGDLDTHEGIAKRIALYSGRPVVSVAYRRAPENPWPAPVDDCLAVTQAVARNEAGIGLDGSRFGLSGDSAGAHLALAVALASRDRGLRQASGALLFYGCYDPSMSGESYARWGTAGYVLTAADVVYYWDQFIGGSAEARRAVDQLNADLSGLPPLYVTAAECDPIADDSRALAARLAAIGAPHELHVWPGMIHGCIGMGRRLNQADRFMAEAGVWIARQLG